MHRKTDRHTHRQTQRDPITTPWPLSFEGEGNHAAKCFLLSTTRCICLKYREIQPGMCFFVYTGAPVLWIMSLKNSFYSASAHVCCWFLTAFLHSFITYQCYLTHKSFKMVDNKSKTSIFGHIQKKYITHKD